MPTLQAFLDKSTKYTKSWSKRFLTLETSSRKLSYGESSQKASKGFIFMTKVTRAAEKNGALKPGNPDLYSFVVEGVKDDGKTEQWALRCPDEPSFCEWYFAIRESIASNGLMDPLNFGLPEADPRSNVPFATVPIEFLSRFSLLERAIIYCFAPATFHSNDPAEPIDQVFVAGDKFLYSFTSQADVTRCVPLTALVKIYVGEMCMGVVVRGHPDFLLKKTPSVVKLCDIVKRTFLAATAKELEIDTSLTQFEQIAAKLALTVAPDYKLDVHSPTPKLKLKHAMDMYEKQTGQKFTYGAAQAPAPSLPKGHEHTADAIDINDPMAALLMRVKLNQYIVPLQRQHIDIDLLSCMEPNDLVNFGINNPAHRDLIIAAAKGEDPVVAAPETQPAFAPAVRQPIVLSDSDDDDLPMPVPKKLIVLDDDDDLMVMPKANAKQIVLTDSDDDLLPSKTGQMSPPPKKIDGDDI